MSEQQSKYYEPGIVALAVNFSEQITDSWEPSDALFDKLFWKAMELVGHADLDRDKLDQSISHYLTESEVDIYSLPEYGADLPDLGI